MMEKLSREYLTTIDDVQVIHFLENEIQMSAQSLLRLVMNFLHSLDLNKTSSNHLVEHLKQTLQAVGNDMSIKIKEDVSILLPTLLKDTGARNAENLELLNDLANKVALKLSETTNIANTHMMKEIGEIQAVIGLLKKDQVTSSQLISKVSETCDLTKTDLQRHLARYDSKGGSIVKGKTAERDLFIQLQKHFIDWEIENVSGVGGQMDILLTRQDCPPIGIECKADDYGNVSHNEVRRFLANVNDTGRHGILVSLYNGISGYKNMDLHITDQGKIAMFLTENKFQMNQIEDCVRLMCKLDGYVSQIPKDTVHDGIHISSARLESIRKAVSAWDNELKDLKKHLKIAVEQTHRLKVNTLLELLTASGDISDSEAMIFVCPFRCKKDFNILDQDGTIKPKSVGGLKKHLQSCHLRTNNFFCSICRLDLQDLDIEGFLKHIRDVHQNT